MEGYELDHPCLTEKPQGVSDCRVKVPASSFRPPPNRPIGLPRSMPLDEAHIQENRMPYYPKDHRQGRQLETFGTASHHRQSTSAKPSEAPYRPSKSDHRKRPADDAPRDLPAVKPSDSAVQALPSVELEAEADDEPEKRPIPFFPDQVPIGYPTFWDEVLEDHFLKRQRHLAKGGKVDPWSAYARLPDNVVDMAAYTGLKTSWRRIAPEDRQRRQEHNIRFQQKQDRGVLESSSKHQARRPRTQDEPPKLPQAVDSLRIPQIKTDHVFPSIRKISSEVTVPKVIEDQENRSPGSPERRTTSKPTPRRHRPRLTEAHETPSPIKKDPFPYRKPSQLPATALFSSTKVKPPKVNIARSVQMRRTAASRPIPVSSTMPPPPPVMPKAPERVKLDDRRPPATTILTSSTTKADDRPSAAVQSIAFISGPPGVSSTALPPRTSPPSDSLKFQQRIADLHSQVERQSSNLASMKVDLETSSKLVKFLKERTSQRELVKKKEEDQRERRDVSPTSGDGELSLSSTLVETEAWLRQVESQPVMRSQDPVVHATDSQEGKGFPTFGTAIATAAMDRLRKGPFWNEATSCVKSSSTTGPLDTPLTATNLHLDQDKQPDTPRPLWNKRGDGRQWFF